MRVAVVSYCANLSISEIRLAVTKLKLPSLYDFMNILTKQEVYKTDVTDLKYASRSLWCVYEFVLKEPIKSTTIRALITGKK